MLFQALSETFRILLRSPIPWIPGIFAGGVTALAIWLELNDAMFIAGKVVFLSLVVFPFFIAGVLHCLKEKSFAAGTFVEGGRRFFFPVLLPGIILAGVIILMIFLLAVPLTIAGFGSDPSMMSGLVIGVTIPALLFAMYYDNAAVGEGLGVFSSLKRSMELFGSGALLSAGFFVISVIISLILALGGATLWGMVLGQKFTPYMEMTFTEQQETFSGFNLTDWHQVLGADGILVTVIAIGVYTALFIPFLIVFKQSCYQSLSAVEPEPYGEFDDKGRWYKY